MATLNETTDMRSRIQQAKDWLQENDTKSIVTTARIFKLKRMILSVRGVSAQSEPIDYQWVSAGCKWVEGTSLVGH